MILPQGILFDLDDTLIDRQRSVAQYTRGFAERFRTRLAMVEVEALVSAYIVADDTGYRARAEMMSELCACLPWVSTPSVDELIADWRQYFAPASQPMNGLYPLFEWLVAQQIRIGVVTNGGAGTQNRKIDALGIRPQCTAIVVSDAVGMRKPDPGIYQQALDQLSLSAENVWFVGDHPINDVIAPATCGMRGIWREGHVAWPVEHPLPSDRFKTLADLHRYILACK